MMPSRIHEKKSCARDASMIKLILLIKIHYPIDDIADIFWQQCRVQEAYK